MQIEIIRERAWTNYKRSNSVINNFSKSENMSIELNIFECLFRAEVTPQT